MTNSKLERCNNALLQSKANLLLSKGTACIAGTREQKGKKCEELFR